MARFFFYGTLLDAEVRAAVIGRGLPADAIVAARLAGFRVARAQDRSYPVLVAAPGRAAEGIVVRGLSAGDVARLFHYEDDGYDTVEVLPARADGRPLRAWVFMPGRRLAAMAEDWTLEGWTQRHKRRTLPLIVAEMARCPGAGAPLRAYRAWRGRRRR